MEAPHTPDELTSPQQHTTLSGIPEEPRTMNSHLHGMQEMHDRLLKLERQNLRLKRIGAAALVVVVSLLIMGQASQKKKTTVEADEFVLRDDRGNVRAKLLMNEATPNPEMLFFDETGKTMLALEGRSEERRVG